MAGDAVQLLTHGIVDDLLAIHEPRLGLAATTAGLNPEAWGQSQVEILTVGGRGYCLHQPLHDYDERTRRVVLRIEEIGHGLHPDQLAGLDIVHADLHPGNLLQTDGRLCAIVDLDYATAGDARFDLMFLAVTSLVIPTEPGVRKRLFEIVLEHVDETRRLAYAGNLLLRLLDWPIRKGRTEEVEFWLTQADRLLDLE